MSLLIAGASGLIGTALAKHFSEQSTPITLLGRNKNKLLRVIKKHPALLTGYHNKNITILDWHQFKNKSQLPSSPFTHIINLCGANIANRPWTTQRKRQLLRSRLRPTILLAQYCAHYPSDKITLINASAIGIYPCHQTLQTLPDSESSLINPDPLHFAPTLVYQWEHACHAAVGENHRVIWLRLAPVITSQGGIIKKLRPLFKLGLGGAIGSGQQPFAWVALQDVVQIVEAIIHHANFSGALNVVSSQRITQMKFARTLAQSHHRPAFMRTPAWLLKMLLGSMAQELLLTGPDVISKRLQELDPKLSNSTSLIDALKHPS